jgi:3-methyladenine DNA glycosylase AlkD
MTAHEVLSELRSLASENIRKILMNHGAPVDTFGVKIEDLKKVLKKTGHDQALAMELYDTGIYDARYLAGLMADGAKMSKKELDHWAKTSESHGISAYTVAWVASENQDGWDIGLEWIESSKETIATSGWSTLAAIVSMIPNEKIDLKEIKSLLKRIEKEIHKAPNYVRYVMNTFVICVGGYIPELAQEAIEIGKRIGKVEVYMGNTACKVPSSPEYIQKMHARGNIKKKKTAKC